MATLREIETEWSIVDVHDAIQYLDIIDDIQIVGSKR